MKSVAFDRAASFYDETRGFPAGVEIPAAAAIARAGNFSTTSQLLEIGIGTGRIALPLAAHVGQITGVDLARPMLERLRSKQQGEAIRVLLGDATRLPLADASVDGTVAAHVFHLIPNWGDALAEIQRVLRPQARLIHCLNLPSLNINFQLDEILQKYGGRRVGVQLADYETFLAAEGWQQVALETHTYPQEHLPAQMLDRLSRRTFGQTWDLTNRQLAVVIDEVREVLLARFGDLNTPVPYDVEFRAYAFLPPA